MAHKSWATALIIWAFPGCLWAQFDQLVTARQAPQARSQQELDDYLDGLNTDSSQERAQRIEAFCRKYPESDLRGIAYQHLMMAYRELGNYQSMIENGEKALKLQPDNLNTLMTLAAAIPNGVTGEGEGDRHRLDRAEEYAYRIFEGIERIRLPRSFLPERWRILRLEMEASAHESLGHIASKRGHLKQAVSEFEKATQENPRPQGSQFYRLGLAYMLTGEQPAAEAALRRAVELGPEEVRVMANTVLERRITKGP